MNHSYKRWACALLALVLMALLSCAALVWAVDPCLYFRIPADGKAVFFNERYQNAGLARNLPADTVLLGTSMVANYRASHVAEVFGGTAVKLTVPDGYLGEFDAVLGQAFSRHTPKRVLFGLDINILTRDEGGVTGALPDYLYDENPMNDVKYLLNRDALYYSAYTLLEKARGAAQILDDAYTWDAGTWWNHMTALENYERPDTAGETLPETAYLANVEGHVNTILSWAQTHPSTEFDVFFPPYSILYWDKTARLGETDAVFSALDAAVKALLAGNSAHNLRVFFLPAATEITGNLDYYCDYIHHSGDAADKALHLLQAGDFEVTGVEAWTEMLHNWRQFVVHYDYDQLWTDAYWWKWNIDHGAPIVWKSENE
ncbi:hypothetical protein [Oscillibacter sp.]|uniref:hypothetical protein n=1 Tax=Oscillibacter sp. TaxID=1945593 RepID=UPI00260791E3|nr:hypothetical protein [Oscillibacter sp.]MDD3347769.1 hypothetical protein [Oscillibacter sp.]